MTAQAINQTNVLPQVNPQNALISRSQKVASNVGKLAVIGTGRTILYKLLRSDETDKLSSINQACKIVRYAQDQTITQQQAEHLLEHQLGVNPKFARGEIYEKLPNKQI